MHQRCRACHCIAYGKSVNWPEIDLCPGCAASKKNAIQETMTDLAIIRATLMTSREHGDVPVDTLSNIADRAIKKLEGLK